MTIRDKILSRIEECERTGNITDVSGLYTALSLIDEQGDQTAKADSGKLDLTLVPTQAIKDIAEVRMYGNAKYPDGGPDNWKEVGPRRFAAALFRHLLAYLDDPTSKDDESGINHYKHLICNAAFICELEAEYD